MSLVGNDVVDLDDPANAGAHLRERFVARVLHESERALLARADEPGALLWSLFAAKEAAYKVLCKHLKAPPVFAHRRFVVAEDLQRVAWEQVSLRLRLTRGVGWVHALAWLGEGPPEAWSVVPVADGEPGLVARRALCAQLQSAATSTAVAPTLEVRRSRRQGSWDGYGPPIVTRDGHALPIDVSLSHDGRFAAFAVVPALS